MYSMIDYLFEANEFFFILHQKRRRKCYMPHEEFRGLANNDLDSEMSIKKKLNIKHT